MPGNKSLGADTVTQEEHNYYSTPVGRPQSFPGAGHRLGDQPVQEEEMASPMHADPRRPDAVLPWQLLKDTVQNATAFLGSEPYAHHKYADYARKYGNRETYTSDLTPAPVPAQVSILEEVLRRAWHPVKFRMRKEYFLAPYNDIKGPVSGFFAGPFMAAATMSSSFEVPILSEVARIALALPALLEFSQGIISLIKALCHKVMGNDVKANMYFRDGVTRLLLTPALILAAIVSVPIELVRFFTRLAATIVHAFRSQPVAECEYSGQPVREYEGTTAAVVHEQWQQQPQYYGAQQQPQPLQSEGLRYRGTTFGGNNSRAPVPPVDGHVVKQAI